MDIACYLETGRFFGYGEGVRELQLVVSGKRKQDRLSSELLIELEDILESSLHFESS